MSSGVYERMEAAAAALGVKLQPLSVRAPEDLQSALAATTRGRAGALVVAPDPMLLSNRRSIIGFAAVNRLPAMYNFREDVEDGGLISYGANLHDTYRRAATFVDIIRSSKAPGRPTCPWSNPRSWS